MAYDFDPNPIYRSLYYEFRLVEITRDLFWLPRVVASNGYRGIGEDHR